jgi:multidrug transporter EmrE-like cation transporter
MMIVALLVCCQVLSITAQLCLKVGAGRAAKIIRRSPLRIFLITPLWFGTTFYGIGTILWLKILTTVDLSFAYPFAAVAYTGGVLAGQWMLKEKVTALRWFGVFLILVGLIFIATSGVSTAGK